MTERVANRLSVPLWLEYGYNGFLHRMGPWGGTADSQEEDLSERS